jgi:8-oxo-dGTP pyrophosphatase MutT (NUDIX family)
LTASALHQAATLVLIRERKDVAPELLMIKRSATMAFGPGAWVFPGGRVDPRDIVFAEATLPEGCELDDHAARIAAIRETIEEAGVAVGLDPLPGSQALRAIRAGLHSGEPFATLLQRSNIRLASEELLPFSRWQPPEAAPIRFDTRFYLARAPEEAAILADGTETIATEWASAESMLARRDARLMFPTLCNLQRIAAQRSFAELALHAASFPSRLIMTETRYVDGVQHLCVPDGHGYPDICLPLQRPART